MLDGRVMVGIVMVTDRILANPSYLDAAMKLKLIVVRGYSPGMVIPAALRQFLIGRTYQCHLRPKTPIASRLHCVILRGKEAVSVRDLESSNGTFINGNRLTGEVDVKDGDILQVGPLVFRFGIEESSSSWFVAAN